MAAWPRVLSPASPRIWSFRLQIRVRCRRQRDSERTVPAVTKRPRGRSVTRIAAVSVGRGEEPRAGGASADLGALTLSGALLLVGFVVNGIQRMIWHPTGAEDDHEAILREYAASDAWEATHLAEFVLVLVALAGLLVHGRVLRPETPYLALLAAGALIATGATWAALQAVD